MCEFETSGRQWSRPISTHTGVPFKTLRKVTKILKNTDVSGEILRPQAEVAQLV
jgi:hypothetical protein